MDYSPSTYKVREREEEGMGEEEKGEEEEGVSPRTGQIPTGEGPGSQSTPVIKSRSDLCLIKVIISF